MPHGTLAVACARVAALCFIACSAGACSDAARDPGHSGHSHQHAPEPVVSIPDDRDAGAREADAGTPGAGPTSTDRPAYAWRLPAWFPEPVVPEDNPMSLVKVELGRHLFYDKRLSDNGTQACASCHLQERAFTDGKLTAVGSTGQHHPRNAMALANVAYAASLTWANPLLLALEQQTIVPIFGDEPVELGMKGKEDELVSRLRSDERYRQLFPVAFPQESDPFSIATLVRAISAFERTLISGDSRYDRYVYGQDSSALSASEKRGSDLFNSERLECFHCHNGFTLQDSINYEGKGPLELRYHNTGLYNVGGRGDYPPPNTGVHELSGKPEDMGRFRVPSLRNIALTAPYMHDGSIATLSEVIDHYAAGGRTVRSGPNAGDGSKNPFKSDFIQGFEISPEERADLIAFLGSLTDEAFITDPGFGDPWPSPCEICQRADAADDTE
jgi:cytochrome c peroxidase